MVTMMFWATPRTHLRTFRGPWLIACLAQE